MLSNNNISPTSVSLQSTTDSPSPSTPQTPSQQPQNPRKRARNSDMTAEEKKDARAHRNRIAAQNSRDKRKLQFSELERRVLDLETENRSLRDALAVTQPAMGLKVSLSERELARERENQDLRDRIKVLEQGWASVVQALSAAGQAIPSLALPPSLTTAAKPPAVAVQQESSSIQAPVAPPTIVLDEGDSTPALSVDGDIPGTPSSLSLNSPAITFSSLTAPIEDSTRHPAAGGFTFGSDVVLDDTFSTQDNLQHFIELQQNFVQSPTTADPQIDAWLQDILQPFPSSPTSATDDSTSSSASASSVTFHITEESSAEPQLVKLEYPATDLSWLLRTGDEVEQLLNLVPATALESEVVDHQLEDLPWARDCLPVVF